MSETEPDYYAIVSREAVEAAANRPDALGALAVKILSSVDEAKSFKDGAKVYLANAGQNRRRFAITAFMEAFGIPKKARPEFKRLLRFWGLVLEGD